MRVYIAAPWTTKQHEAQIALQALTHTGHHVTSRWIEETPGEPSERYAREDLDDVADADVLLLLNLPGSTGGMWIEFGYALALNKRIILVGERTNVFHYLGVVEVVETLEQAIKRMSI